jgi:hypothetical protein
MSAVATMSSLIASPLFLRRVLWLDAATCAATALLQLLLAGVLAGLLGLPKDLLVESGWLLVACVAGIGFIATRRSVPAAGVWLLIAVNLLWVGGCLLLLWGGGVSPTLPGKVFIAVQALAVGVLAELQWLALRQAGAGHAG